MAAFGCEVVGKIANSFFFIVRSLFLFYPISFISDFSIYPFDDEVKRREKFICTMQENK